MDRVPARADEIFDQLMELDRCVVLFDEIDELIRERQAPESDPFGRFLTTTMLPKLAKLWKQRRLLYFVATNDIDAADPAIQRSQRFDAAIFVPPPSFAVKRGLLMRELQLSKLPDGLTEANVNDALAHDYGEHPLGVFALLRYDQIFELADRLHAEAKGEAVDGRILEDVLEGMGEELKEREWRYSKLDDPFEVFNHWARSERRDGRALRLVRMESEPPRDPAYCEPFHVVGEEPRYYKIVGPFEQAITQANGDLWQLSIDGWEARDDQLLTFTETRPDSD
jgi:SpoVK/Ycf46/Vps4 family AAA+-type ATPase